MISKKGRVIKKTDEIISVHINDDGYDSCCKQNDHSKCCEIEALNNCGAKVDDLVIIHFHNGKTLKIILSGIGIPFLISLLGIGAGIVLWSTFGDEVILKAIWTITLFGILLAIIAAQIGINMVDMLRKVWQSGVLVAVAKKICDE